MALTNQGFTIEAIEMYDQTHGIALGFKSTWSTAGRHYEKWVTWEVTLIGEGYDYYWGHYFDSRVDPDPDESARLEKQARMDYHGRLNTAYFEQIR